MFLLGLETIEKHPAVLPSGYSWYCRPKTTTTVKRSWEKRLYYQDVTSMSRKNTIMNIGWATKPGKVYAGKVQRNHTNWERWSRLWMQRWRQFNPMRITHLHLSFPLFHGHNWKFWVQKSSKSLEYMLKKEVFAFFFLNIKDVEGWTPSSIYIQTIFASVWPKDLSSVTDCPDW